MAQTTTMSKLRGRHYAARARASRASPPSSLSSSAPPATNSNSNSNSNAESSNEQRYRSSTRFQNTRTATVSNKGEMEYLQEISDRLETGLNGTALKAIVDLLRNGESPDAIVAVVTSLSQKPR